MSNNKLDMKVLIKCKTYNHEKYITKALDGIAKQKTDFSYLAVVVDDASTDTTADILREFESRYPDRIKGIYLKENHYSRGLSNSQYINHYLDQCEYVAYCEGDDYWTDPLKLQKQVDFLDNHPDYGMCYAKCAYYNEETQSFDDNVFGGPCESFEDLMQSYNTIPTLTVLYRRVLEKTYLDFLRKSGNKWRMGDYPRWLFFAKESKIKFMDEVFGVYRVLPNSASHSTSVEKKLEFDDSMFDIKVFFDQYYQCGNHDRIEKARTAHRLRLYCENGMVSAYFSHLIHILLSRKGNLSFRCFLYWIYLF